MMPQITGGLRSRRLARADFQESCFWTETTMSLLYFNFRAEGDQLQDRCSFKKFLCNEVAGYHSSCNHFREFA